MLASAQAELLKRTLALLTREQLVGADPTAHSYSTPRRLAVLIHGVLTQQPDITEETTGPAVKIAFKDGVPTPAAEAFARKSGVAVSELKTISTPKGDYLAATTTKKGRSAAEVLAAELPKEIAGIYWAKNMYWRAGKPERFVRPVLWLACLLGEEVVPVTFAGKTAGRATYGHRVLSTGEPFEIQTPEQLPRAAGRRVRSCRRRTPPPENPQGPRQSNPPIPNARWREDEALVDAVTHLTEWPDVLLGNFEPAYLDPPRRSPGHGHARPPEIFRRRVRQQSGCPGSGLSDPGVAKLLSPALPHRNQHRPRRSEHAHHQARATSASSAPASTTPASSGSSTSACPSPTASSCSKTSPSRKTSAATPQKSERVRILASFLAEPSAHLARCRTRAHSSKPPRPSRRPTSPPNS